MKKLMIAALAIVAFAAVSEAANYKWQAKTGFIFQAGSTTDKAAGTAYIFNAGTYAQSTLLEDLATSSLESLANAHSVYTTGSGENIKAVGTDLVGGQIPLSALFAYDGVDPSDTPNTWNAYFALVMGDNVYISSPATATATSAVTGNTIPFASQAATSQATAKMASGGYKGAGWYTVPEPTSGLLLLLGVAGMALRRRRA